MGADWYVRQFGDREQFAISIALGRDPHPTGDEETDAGWGGLELWVRGHCLTRSVSEEGGTQDDVRWNLRGVLEWLRDTGSRLVNEDPFPLAVSRDQVRDASDWFNRTEQPLLSLTNAEEVAWFEKRSDWRQHHAIRRAALDVALPNISLRRQGESVEISWDNETWRSTRPSLVFVEQRGTALVNARQVASALREALCDATAALANQYPFPDLRNLADLSAASVAAAEDWRWLIHRDTAQVLAPALSDALTAHSRAGRDGWYVPHSPETLALRQAHLVSRADVEAFLESVRRLPLEPMSEQLQALLLPSQAPATRPWVEGYERAMDVREALDLGDDPIPDLNLWLAKHGIRPANAVLTGSVALVARRTEEFGAAVTLNPNGSSRLRREIGHAAALGHVLLDDSPVAVEGTWEHWPTAARARAFGVMFLLPLGGVRDVLQGKASLDADDVERLMQRFHTGAFATTFHLKNNGFFDEERRVEILHELVA